jgi:hypothetical protein
MGSNAITGRDLIEQIRANGIPEPWQEFGWGLARDGALSNALADRGLRHRARPGTSHRPAIRRLFAEKPEDLRTARGLLHATVREHDRRLRGGFPPWRSPTRI